MQNPTILEAIKTKQNITFEYNGKERHISPWIYGKKFSRTMIMGYQHAGGNFEGFRQFAYEDMTNIRINSDKFISPKVTRSDPWEEIYAEL